MTTWYLQMLSAEQFKSNPFFQEKARVEVLAKPDPEVNQWFYRTVGESLAWIERRNWSLDQWRDYVEQPNIITAVGYLAQDEIGYFELQSQNNGADIEIAYFGLLPEAVGQGLGAGLLSAAITQAWEQAPQRVWVHTCSLDHPHALSNYQARGFEVYHTETL